MAFMAKHTDEMTWRAAITKILEESGRVMDAQEVTEKIIERKLRTNLGTTPLHTVCTQLNVHSKKDNPAFVKVEPGQFIINSNRATTKEVNDKDEGQIEEFTDSVLTAFGMFWRRELVEWKNKPKILGCQLTGSDKVDFCDQTGVYFLYDGREVIYVGRCTDRPLGIRLYEHTRDRLATRWDRFSWFGLLPVSENGKLGEMPSSYHSNALIPAFEAMLIEALEPRQNRKRGDDLPAVEFIQSEDPSIHNKRLKDEVSSILDRIS